VKIYRYPVETEHFQWLLYSALAMLAIAQLLIWTKLGVLP
jgi:hypothetical protein